MRTDGAVILTLKQWDGVSETSGISEVPDLWRAHFEGESSE
jgi:hypothetical protein